MLREDTMRHAGVALLLVLPAPVGAEEPAPAGSEAVVATPTKAVEPQSVAVLEFKADGIDATVTRNLNELFTSEAGRVPGYKIIGFSEIKEMLSFEAQKQTLGCTDEGCASAVGGALGVGLIVAGSVGQVGEHFVVNLKLIDIRTAQATARVGETIAGRVELLTDAIRIAAWKLLSGNVPADLLAMADATRARLDADAAKAAGDAAALAAAQRALAEAEKAKAEAEKAKAEAEIAKAKQAEAKAEETRRTYRPKPVSATEPPPSTAATGEQKGGIWRVSRSISSAVGGLGLVGGGVCHGISYYVSTKVGDAKSLAGGGEVYAGTQKQAQLSQSLRTWAIVGYAVGATGVVAATLLRIFEPESSTPTAVRVTPTGTGILVEF
jgi:TolB-like protein